MKRPIQTIQILRAVAALGVLFLHLGNYFIPVDMEIGRYGVDMFFILSGFTISYIHINKIDSSKKFFLKRLIRIYPPYLEIIFLTILINYFLKIDRGFNIPANLFFTDYDPENFGHPRKILEVAWTLSYEIWFYFVFGLSMKIFKDKFLYGIWFFLILTLLNQFVFKLNSFFFSWRNFEFCAGVFLCFFLKEKIISWDKKIKYPNSLLLIGDASYSLYLIHLPLIGSLGHLLHKFTSDNIFIINIFWYWVTLVLIIYISILNYDYVEKPMIKFLKKLIFSEKQKLVKTLAV